MNVLVIGSGGREHAIIWGLKNSPKVKKIFCAPGNAGIEQSAKTIPIKADDIYGLAQFAQTNAIDVTIVGSETPLVKGIVDLFEDRGLKIFGPSQRAAQLEGSKIFLKNFLRTHHIPTAAYETFSLNEFSRAKKYLSEYQPPFVIKTDGLAAGKGVAICGTIADAEKTLKEYFEEKIFGDAGTNVVIEEFLQGEEASVFAMCDGEDYVLLSPAQDHKRIGDNDTGKNTGGMGAYAPAPIVTEEVLRKVEKEIIQPTLRGMKAEGAPYKGCLYVGLMIHDGIPKVVEFNVRLGDPETQAVLPLIESDLFDLFYSCAAGTLKNYRLQMKKKSAVVVVLASKGYPDHYESGMPITGLENISGNSVVFHAGTKFENKKIVAAGGRVLGVTSFGNSLGGAIEQCYAEIPKIQFEHKYFRTDIGRKGLQK
ncbi:MAG: phosphoribosylamine--glycine ligase [Bacteroidetes bacterium]|nr:phosphoribosylamine--glycine ligase [Bacteroidota bacterium]